LLNHVIGIARDLPSSTRSGISYKIAIREMASAPILAALATSCRMLSNGERVQLAEKKEVFEFHLEWVSLCVLCGNSAFGEELSEEMQLQFDDLALRMAQFILNYEKKRLDEASYFASQFSKAMTRRQREIVQLLAEGRPNREIADVLRISEKTVEFHKRHVRELFNLHNNADIVLFALKQGLISLNPSSSDSPK